MKNCVSVIFLVDIDLVNNRSRKNAFSFGVTYSLELVAWVWLQNNRSRILSTFESSSETTRWIFELIYLHILVKDNLISFCFFSDSFILFLMISYCLLSSFGVIVQN